MNRECSKVQIDCHNIDLINDAVSELHALSALLKGSAEKAHATEVFHGIGLTLERLANALGNAKDTVTQQRASISAPKPTSPIPRPSLKAVAKPIPVKTKPVS